MEALTFALYPTIEPKFKNTPVSQPITSNKPDLYNPLASLESTLNSILPTQTEETSALKTRKYLGETAKTLSDEQIECIATEFQFLANTWLDEYERDVFDGKTLKEVLHEG